MKRLVWSALSDSERRTALARPANRTAPEVEAVVRRIFEETEQEGAAAVDRWARKLDGAPLRVFDISRAAVAQAETRLEREDIAAIERAVDQVRFYHEATKPKPHRVEIGAGVVATQIWRPISSCGLYAPGGGAPLVSTLIMLAEPARIAGVSNRIVVTPPRADGAPHPAMIIAAAACGVDAIHLVGGAQAIAALTFGAGAPRAQKLFGPGNAYVTAAKKLASLWPGGPAIDLPAGPSELMIIADAAADPAFIAADLLSQAEHDGDAQVILVATSAELIDAVEAQIRAFTPTLPRAGVIGRSLEQARFIKAESLKDAAAIANLYAPEHLSIQTRAPDDLVDAIQHAGAIFVGALSGECFGDYVTGPSHVLPTDGAAAAHGGVTVAAFMKSLTVQSFEATGVRALAPAAARIARLEGLEAHALAADMRVRAIAAADQRPGTDDIARSRRRIAETRRKTKETDIAVRVDLDRAGACAVRSGVGFLDHMFEQVALHGGFSLTLSCAGDLHIDAHHTIEDCALALGAALKEALGDKRGAARFGFSLPMDEARAQVLLDLSGRPYLVFEGEFEAPMLGPDYPTEMTEHVFRSLAQSLGCTLHVSVTGENDHHKTEACFKAFGRALRQAIRIEDEAVASTKGAL